jgi:1,2-diacylglycerol 3-beta-glucosyltransferase
VRVPDPQTLSVSPLVPQYHRGWQEEHPMVVAIEIVLLIIFGFLLLYLALLSILALTARKPLPMATSRYRQLAVVVPANDEELSIGTTLKSLFAVDYPRDGFDVIVIADHCNDRTAEVARKLGAIVYERTNCAMRGKGYALRWCFDLLLSQDPAYDAVIVVDADSVISKNFLNVMNSYIEAGADVVQSSDMVDPQPGSWSAEVTRVGFILYNHVRPLGRRVIRCSAGLRGNGMCFTVDTLRRIPWRAFSLAEDLEYGLTLLLNGVTVVFAPEAKAFATMPADARNAVAQRTRWEGGRYPVIRRYAGRLLAAALKRRSFKAFDALVDLITPPFVNLLAIVGMLLCVNLLFSLVGVKPVAQFTWLWLTLIGIAAVHVIAGLYAADADQLAYKALLYVPRYALWKLAVYTRILRRDQTNRWIRTSREGAAPQKD